MVCGVRSVFRDSIEGFYCAWDSNGVYLSFRGTVMGDSAVPGVVARRGRDFGPAGVARNPLRRHPHTYFIAGGRGGVLRGCSQRLGVCAPPLPEALWCRGSCTWSRVRPRILLPEPGSTSGASPCGGALIPFFGRVRSIVIHRLLVDNVSGNAKQLRGPRRASPSPCRRPPSWTCTTTTRTRTESRSRARKKAGVASRARIKANPSPPGRTPPGGPRPMAHPSSSSAPGPGPCGRDPALQSLPGPKTTAKRGFTPPTPLPVLLRVPTPAGSAHTSTTNARRVPPGVGSWDPHSFGRTVGLRPLGVRRRERNSPASRGGPHTPRRHDQPRRTPPLLAR